MSQTFNNGSLFNFVVKDGNGIKGLVDSGLTKVPDRYIQPPNERIHKNDVGFSNENLIIDLADLDGPNHDRVVRAIVKASETVGFFQVVNHGLPLALLESLKDAAHRFFNQPAEKKSVYLKGESISPLVTYGTSFVPDKEKELEWKDYVSMLYTNDDDALKIWPDECKHIILEYLKSSLKMVRRLCDILVANLGVTLDDSRFAELAGFKMLNMNFYPKCPDPELTIGVGRHSDMGMLTVLLQDGIGGLYVKLENENDSKEKEKWIPIPPLDGALVINVGDTLQILSNGRYKSAEHRVRTTSLESRVSVPIFNLPLPTTKIGPLPQVVVRDGVARYKEVVFKDYMNNFFGKVHRGKKSLDFARTSSG